MSRRDDRISWELTAAALAQLLARLDPDRDRAGERYEALRAALVKFFDWRGAAVPDERADETLNRVARKLEAGIEIADVAQYAIGVARLVLLEEQRGPHRRGAVAVDVEVALADVAVPEADPDSSLDPIDDARVRECLRQCLAQLAPESRDLILQYYGDDKRAKIDARQALARSLGLTANALRSRAQRVRGRLERCIDRCLRARAIAARDTER